MSKFRRTQRGHDPLVLVSLLQKAIRRNRPDLAGYAASDLLRSGYETWMWRRICVTAAEDVAALVQPEINALREASERENLARKGGPTRVFAMKAVLLLCAALKSRDPDHLSNLVVDRIEHDDPRLIGALADAEADIGLLPAWVFDVHTPEGRRRGATRRQFFVGEHAALTPRQPGLFDDIVEALRDD